MSPFAGPLFAAALLLAGSGVLKVARPTSAAHALRAAGLPGSGTAGRVLGAAEVVLALAALAVGGRVTAALVAACYLGFAAFVLRVRATAGDRAGCGCFGAEEAPATPLHVVVNLLVAVAAGLAVVRPTRGVVWVTSHTPLAGIPFLGFTAVLA
ncbi:MAG TPA: MauE/DoxX family redox-associated membrane protein, partial [Acidimicrobiales bacterium]